MPHNHKDREMEGAKGLHRARIVLSFALAGAAIGGAVFGWVPAIGFLSVHEIGAALGLGAGVIASIRHMV